MVGVARRSCSNNLLPGKSVCDEWYLFLEIKDFRARIFISCPH